MRSSASIRATVALALVFACAANASAAPSYKVLHAFTSGDDGSAPFAGVTFDTQGNLYGTTWGGGGKNVLGTVFKLTPTSGGRWSERVLHRFSDPGGGGGPFGGVVFDTEGSVYGTTRSGGANGVGTVFKMTRGADGWAFNVLDNYGSNAGLILDKAGNLYGPIGHGKYGGGTVTEMVRGSDGWAEKVLYNFCAQLHCADGDLPYAGLTWDAAGNLYGTTEYGGKGSPQWGTAFELRHNPDGTWQHILLHSFPSFPGDGEVVYAGLVFDTSGNLYGATNSGGGHLCGQTSTCGTVFKLNHNPNGLWKEAILYRFANLYDGNSPGASLVFDETSGNLYGTAATGGNNACANGCGVVFKLTPNSDGSWKYSVVHRFTGSDGANPAAALILDQKGNLYGTTTLGGAGGYGVVFEITP
jgi:uncharacterized repeat protein (TIGR03803 family)